jgi:hypothetical protein
VQACGALPGEEYWEGWEGPYKPYGMYADHIVPLLYARAMECGHGMHPSLPPSLPSIVQLAPIMAYLDSSFSVRGFFFVYLIVFMDPWFSVSLSLLPSLPPSLPLHLVSLSI